jgi:chromosome segregation ATPase
MSQASSPDQLHQRVRDHLLSQRSRLGALYSPQPHKSPGNFLSHSNMQTNSPRAEPGYSVAGGGMQMSAGIQGAGNSIGSLHYSGAGGGMQTSAGIQGGGNSIGNYSGAGGVIPGGALLEAQRLQAMATLSSAQRDLEAKERERRRLSGLVEALESRVEAMMSMVGEKDERLRAEVRRWDGERRALLEQTDQVRREFDATTASLARSQAELAAMSRARQSAEERAEDAGRRWADEVARLEAELERARAETQAARREAEVEADENAATLAAHGARAAAAQELVEDLRGQLRACQGDRERLERQCAQLAEAARDQEARHAALRSEFVELKAHAQGAPEVERHRLRAAQAAEAADQARAEHSELLASVTMAGNDLASFLRELDSHLALALESRAGPAAAGLLSRPAPAAPRSLPRMEGLRAILASLLEHEADLVGELLSLRERERAAAGEAEAAGRELAHVRSHRAELERANGVLVLQATRHGEEMGRMHREVEDLSTLLASTAAKLREQSALASERGEYANRLVQRLLPLVDPEDAAREESLRAAAAASAVTGAEKTRQDWEDTRRAGLAALASLESRLSRLLGAVHTMTATVTTIQGAHGSLKGQLDTLVRTSLNERQAFEHRLAHEVARAREDGEQRLQRATLEASLALERAALQLEERQADLARCEAAYGELSEQLKASAAARSALERQLDEALAAGKVLSRVLVPLQRRAHELAGQKRHLARQLATASVVHRDIRDLMLAMTGSFTADQQAQHATLLAPVRGRRLLRVAAVAVLAANRLRRLARATRLAEASRGSGAWATGSYSQGLGRPTAGVALEQVTRSLGVFGVAVGGGGGDDHGLVLELWSAFPPRSLLEDLAAGLQAWPYGASAGDRLPRTDSERSLEVIRKSTLAVTARLRAVERERAQALQDLREVQRRLDITEERIVDSEAALAEERRAHELLQQRHSGLAMEVHSMVSSEVFHTVHAQVSGLAEDRDALKRDAARADQRCAEMAEECSRLQEELDQARERARNKSSEHDREVNELRRAARTVEEHLRATAAEAEDLRAELSDRRTDVAGLLEQLGSLDAAAQSLRRQLDVANDELRSHRAQLSSAQARAADATAQAEAARADARDRQASLERVHAENRILTAQCHQLCAELAALTQREQQEASERARWAQVRIDSLGAKLHHDDATRDPDAEDDNQRHHPFAPRRGPIGTPQAASAALAEALKKSM